MPSGLKSTKEESDFCSSGCVVKVEKLARTLFLWKLEVHEQKEKVYEMRRWNEALVTNMLPEHVARHFLGTKKRDEVKLLLSHTFSYFHPAEESIVGLRSAPEVILPVSLFTTKAFFFPWD